MGRKAALDNPILRSTPGAYVALTKSSDRVTCKNPAEHGNERHHAKTACKESDLAFPNLKSSHSKYIDTGQPKIVNFLMLTD